MAPLMVARTPSSSTLARAVALGGLGIFTFGLTLPMTILALADFTPLSASLFRAVLAAPVALAVIAVRRFPVPSRADLGWLFLTGLGVVIGFPLLMAEAMVTVPPGHGGVVLGVLPIFTAVGAALILRERPTALFWLWSGAGAALVIAVSLQRGGGGLAWGDGLLLLGALAATFGYVTGARLSRRMGGTAVICWVVVVMAPVTCLLLIVLGVQWPATVTATGLVGLAYLVLGSQLGGFFAWYAGLALGGVARIGQVQLLQPFVTLGAAGAMFGEWPDIVVLSAAALTAVFVYLALRERFS